MIQSRTIINVADNSGAKKISCIQVKGTSKNDAAKMYIYYAEQYV